MEPYIVCPQCKKTIENNSTINDAARRIGSDSQSVICACGERISYWKITAQLQDQQKFIRLFQNWAGSLSPSGS